MPPDLWDPSLPAVRIARQPSGIIEFVTPALDNTIHLTERNDSAAWLGPSGEASATSTEARLYEENLSSTYEAQRGWTEKSREEQEDKSEPKGIFEAFKGCSFFEWAWTNLVTFASSTELVLQRLKNGLKRL